MDLKDRKLIYLLDLNSRTKETDLAKALNLSKQVVNYRIKKLLNKGVIINCQTMLSISAFNTPLYAQVYGKFLEAGKKKTEEIINYLKNHPKVGYLAIYGGRFDFTISIAAKDLQDFDEQLREIFSKYPRELRQYIVAMRIFNRRFPRNYLIDLKSKRETKETFSKPIDQKKIDEIDKKILSLLVTNSRMPMLEISGKLKIPFSTVRTRISLLEKRKIIVGYSLLIDLSKLGYQIYKIFIKTRDRSPSVNDRLMAFATQHPNIPWFQKTLGDHDYELRIEVKDQESFQEIIRQLREDFSEVIEDIETLMVFKEIKEDYGVLLN